MTKKDESVEHRILAAETLAYLIEVSAYLQRVAAISNHLISSMASFLNWADRQDNNNTSSSTAATTPAAAASVPSSGANNNLTGGRPPEPPGSTSPIGGGGGGGGGGSAGTPTPAVASTSASPRSTNDNVAAAVTSASAVALCKEMRRAAFRVFASLGANDEEIRKRIIETDNLMPSLVSALEDESAPKLQMAAVGCLHSLSRSVQLLRTTFQVNKRGFDSFSVCTF